MKNFRHLGLGLFMGVMLLACQAGNAEPKPTPQPSFYLVKDGKPAATIVVPDKLVRLPIELRNNPDQEFYQDYAAKELQTFIKRSTGATLPLVKASNAPKAGTLILVGQSAVSKQLGLKAPKKPEGFIVSAFSRGLAILGEVAPKGTNYEKHAYDRGVLFGVFEVLEQVMECRFFFHDPKDPDFGMVVPETQNIKVPGDLFVSKAPDFPYRTRGVFRPHDHRLEWLRVARMGVSTAFDPNHTDENWGEVFFKDHPEYFATNKDGSQNKEYLCYSEPKVLEQRIKNIEHFYKTGKLVVGWRKHTQKFVNFVPKDLYIKQRCHCEKCKPRFTPEKGRYGKISNIIFDHGAKLANEVKKRWPEKRVAMIAYEEYMQPPDFDLPDNLDVMVCIMNSTMVGKEDWNHNRNIELLRAWSKRLGGDRERLYVWTYPAWPGRWTKVPMITPFYMQKWLKEAHQYANGEFINYGGHNLQEGHLMNWLWHKLLWNRNADVGALIKDYCQSFFGPSASAMEAFYLTFIHRFEGVQWSKKFSKDLAYVPAHFWYGETFTPEIIAELKGHMQKALNVAPKDGKNIFNRRMLWMEDGFAPFFDEADQWHKLSKAKKPKFKVKTMIGDPANPGSWNKTAKVKMVRGQYGQKGDCETQCSWAVQGDHVYAYVETDQKQPLEKNDWVEMAFYPDGTYESRLDIKVSHLGKVSGELAGKLLCNRIENNKWKLVFRFSKGDLLKEAKGKVTLNANVVRQQTFHGTVPDSLAEEKRYWLRKGVPYKWVPQLEVFYQKDKRFGRLIFEH